MKRMLKIVGIIFLVIVLIVATLLIWFSTKPAVLLWEKKKHIHLLRNSFRV